MNNLKLQSWNDEKERFYYFQNGRYYKDVACTDAFSERICHEFSWMKAEISLGMMDKNGVEIFSGMTVNFRRPIRSEQTHEGDNIPMGSYTEPLEPEILSEELEVNLKDGCYHFGDTPAMYFIVQYSLDEAKEEFCGSWSSYDTRFIWDDEDEGDLQYLLGEYDLSSEKELVDYLGVEVIVTKNK